MQVQSLGRKDPLKEGIATHSSILAWRIPWTEEPGRLQSTGSQRTGQDLEETQAGIKIAWTNINILRYADDTSLMAEREEELKSLLMKVKVESESWLKAQHSENKDHGIWSHHFRGNRWGNSENSVRLYFGGAQNHCRW